MSEATAAPSCLQGISVLDAAQLLPGPYAAQILADLGARVTKVEPPGGDGARQIRGELFAATNRNKDSIVLDLKSDEGRAAFLDLARTTDVIIEGYRPGVMARLGLGYADIARINDQVVYCSISGYGQDGPTSKAPGHDINYFAASGALSFSGHWGEEPRRPGVPMADVGASSFAVIAILAALQERPRTRHGCHLDVSMADVLTALAAVRGGPRLERSADDRSHLYPTNDVFDTADGRRLALGAVEERFWQAARVVLAEDEPALADVRFDGLDGRLRHGDELHDLLHRVFAGRSLADWMERFAGTDAPVSPVRGLDEVADQAIAAGSDLVQQVGGQRHVVFPVRRNGVVMGRLRSPAPDLVASEAGEVRTPQHGREGARGLRVE